jgi:hypothetical protein
VTADPIELGPQHAVEFEAIGVQVVANRGDHLVVGPWTTA